MVVEGAIWAIEQLADKVCSFDAAALHIMQAMLDGGLAADLQVVQLQQQLAPNGQSPVVAPDSNLHKTQSLTLQLARGST